MRVAAVHPTCVQDDISYEVGASIEGARALMAAVDQPSFGQNLPVEVKLEKDHPNVGDGSSKLPGGAKLGDDKTVTPPGRAKAKGKAKAKAKAASTKEVLTEVPDAHNLKAFRDDWIDNVSNAQGECTKLSSEFLDGPIKSSVHGLDVCLLRVLI